MNPRTHIAAFITGHSIRGCTGLSQEQREFQRRSAIPQEHWLHHNFPYHETFPYPESFPVVAASLNNARHVVSSWLPAFRKRHRDAVSEIFSPYDAVILLAGSCGLELINNLDLPGSLRDRLHVFAYGPVSRRLPTTASLLVVQGKGDFISRLFHREAHHRIDCSHMGYLVAPEMPHLFKEFFDRVLQERALAA